MDDIDLLKDLAGNEELLSSLYNIFALQFPATTELWERLSAQETGHAEIIKELYPMVSDGTIKLQPGRFNRQAVATTRDYIKQLFFEAPEKDLVWAFSVALDIEKSFLEHEFFTVFKADSQELALVLNQLREDTRRHYKMIEDAWKKFKTSL